MHSQYQPDAKQNADAINAVIQKHIQVLESMKSRFDIGRMPSKQWLRHFFAMEALNIIQRANESKPLGVHHFEALFSFPAIANDWNLIMQHPSLQLLSDEKKKNLGEVIGQLDAQLSAKVTKLNLEKDNLLRLAQAVAPASMSEQQGHRRRSGN